VQDLIAALRQAIGEDSVLSGAEALEQLPAGSRAQALLLPRSTEQVSQALGLCQRAGRAVVALGGLTGLVHGTSTRPEEVALSLSRLRQIEEIDPLNRCMTVQAGVPLQAAQAAAEEAGLLLPVDLGARGTATIGGMISTNAGGTRVLRFGMMREQVLGLEAVLADGTVIDSRSKLLKNNTGYDLKQLFVGTEGTLGIITRAVLRLRPSPSFQGTALVSLESFAQVTRFLTRMEARLFNTLSSFEVMWQPFYQLVTSEPARGRPILTPDHPYYVLLETLGMDADKDQDSLAVALADAHAEGLITGAALAQSGAQRRQMWALRDDVEQLRRHGPSFAYDVSLSLEAMEGYVAQIERQLREHFSEHRLYVFGHLADGNLHVVVQVPDASAYERVSEIVYGALASRNSSVSAEHGIGLLKKGDLARSRSAAELELMRVLKRALDPGNILNPGKVFDIASARAG
jgi:FAD/FMN-containing dehydrogenase